MSQSKSPHYGNGLSNNEKAVFERLAEKFEDDEAMSRLCEIVLQSDENLEANS